VRELFSAEERSQLDEAYEEWKASPGAERVLLAEKTKASQQASHATRQ